MVLRQGADPRHAECQCADLQHAECQRADHIILVSTYSILVSTMNWAQLLPKRTARWKLDFLLIVRHIGIRHVWICHRNVAPERGARWLTEKGGLRK
jgi:hypothetical protein